MRALLLAICAAALSGGCASHGRLFPTLLQSPISGQRAGVMPGNWEQVDVLRPGSRVIVTLMNGERLECAFKAVGPGELDLIDSSGRAFGVARSNIRQIVARGQRDRLVNGALVGAGIGLATATAVLAVAASGDGYLLASAKWGAPLLLSAAGAVVGVFVDRAHGNDRVVYVR